MVVLDPEFSFERNGITARLVCEDDARFISELRNNPQRGKYLHSKSADIKFQIDWIREYKLRERNGKEYYFIFLKDKKEYGLMRIYNIDWEHLTFTIGSWVCSELTPFQLVAASVSLTLGIAFNYLGLLLFTFDVKKDNLQLLNLYRRLPFATEYGETDTTILFYSSKKSASLVCDAQL